MSFFDAIAARETALARCRRDGGPLFVVTATGVEGAVFESETLPDLDAQALALELRLNANQGAWKVDGQAVASIEVARVR
jgi:hypothetical protein